jgi:hypothetical protein
MGRAMPTATNTAVRVESFMGVPGLVQATIQMMSAARIRNTPVAKSTQMIISHAFMARIMEQGG